MKKQARGKHRTVNMNAVVILILCVFMMTAVVFSQTDANSIKESGKWLEIVYLMVPTLNDDPVEISDLCDWIIKELGPDVPVHFTRFHPQYLLKDLPPTPVKSLEAAYQTARDKGINFPYVGNVYGHEGEDTYCPGCGEAVVERSGFRIDKIEIENGACKKCGRIIPGVWL